MRYTILPIAALLSTAAALDSVFPNLGLVCKASGIMIPENGRFVMPVILELDPSPVSPETEGCVPSILHEIRSSIQDVLTRAAILHNGRTTYEGELHPSISNAHARKKRFFGIAALAVGTAAMSLSIANRLTIESISDQLGDVAQQTNNLIVTVETIREALDYQSELNVMLNTELGLVGQTVSSIVEILENNVIPSLNEAMCNQASIIEVVKRVPQISLFLSSLQVMMSPTFDGRIDLSIMSETFIDRLIDAMTGSISVTQGLAPYINTKSLITDLGKFVVASIHPDKLIITGYLILPLIPSWDTSTPYTRYVCEGIGFPCQSAYDVQGICNWIVPKPFSYYKGGKFYAVSDAFCENSGSISTCDALVCASSIGAPEPCLDTSGDGICDQTFMPGSGFNRRLNAHQGFLVACPQGGCSVTSSSNVYGVGDTASWIPSTSDATIRLSNGREITYSAHEVSSPVTINLDIVPSFILPTMITSSVPIQYLTSYQNARNMTSSALNDLLAHNAQAEYPALSLIGMGDNSLLDTKGIIAITALCVSALCLLLFINQARKTNNNNNRDPASP